MDANQQHFTALNNLPLSFRLGNYYGEFLYWGFYTPEYWRNFWHVHSFYEVCYAYQGEGTFRISEQRLPVYEGQVFVAKPNEPHEIMSSHKAPLGIYFWAYTLSLTTRSSVKEKTVSVDADREMDQLLQAFTQQSCAVSAHVGSIPTTLLRLSKEIAEYQPGYRTQIQALITTLLIETARAIVTTQMTGRPLTRSDNPAVDTMVRYLHDNYDRPLQIRDVAAQLHMSERHTSRLFRHVMGQTIQQYLTDLRLNVAKQRLLDQSLPVSEIATSLGYKDVRHFSTRFRQQTGTTPTHYRATGGTQFQPDTESEFHAK